MKTFLVISSLALLFMSSEASDRVCVDRFNLRTCNWFVKNRYCTSHSPFAKEVCAKTCGLCDTVPGTTGPPTPAPTTPKPGTCGQPPIQGQRVIAGVTATRGSWPWQILMLFDGSGGCGGSIVSPKHVITAAHCVEGRTDYLNRFRIRVGEHNTQISEGSEKDYRVKAIHVHPEYQWPVVLNNDIAIFELEKPIQFNTYVQPVCLPDQDVPVGTDCYITGWGKVRHPGYMTNILQQAKMPVVSKEVCNAKNFASIRIPVTNAMICSGDGGNTRKSGCHGDSGGPFVCHVNGRWELHGAVSHGSPRCASTETYTVFARIAYLRKWINGIINQ